MLNRDKKRSIVKAVVVMFLAENHFQNFKRHYVNIHDYFFAMNVGVIHKVRSKDFVFF